jgi:hypothetical protein
MPWRASTRPYGGDAGAVIEDQDPVREAHDELHIVLDEKDGDPPLADADDQVGEVLGLGGVEARSRLVEEEDLRAGGEGPGDLEAALLPIGKPTGGLLGDVAHPDEGQGLMAHTLDLLLLAAEALRPEERVPEARGGPVVGPDLHVVQGREVGEEADVLEGAGHFPARDLAGPAPRGVLPENLDAALGGLLQAGDHVEHGRLPRTVGSDQADDLTDADLEVDRVHRHQTAEALGDPLDLDRRAPHLSPPSRERTRRHRSGGRGLRAGSA